MQVMHLYTLPVVKSLCVSRESLFVLFFSDLIERNVGDGVGTHYSHLGQCTPLLTHRLTPLYAQRHRDIPLTVFTPILVSFHARVCHSTISRFSLKGVLEWHCTTLVTGDLL